MAWYDNIGNTVGGFFGQEDDRLRELRMQNSADFNIAGNSEQAKMLAEQDRMFEDNATFDSGWDLKGMAKSFLGDGEAAAPAAYKHDMSLQYGAGAKPAVQPVQAQMPQKPQQSQAANAIMAAMQNNQQMQPQAVQQPQPTMFQKMMGFA